MKQGLGMQMEQSQRLRMTPELVQAIGLLQLNTQDLSTYIQEQLLVNPVLETATESEGGAGAGPGIGAGSEAATGNESEWSDRVERIIDLAHGSTYDTAEQSYMSEEDDAPHRFESYAIAGTTLKESLMQQLSMSALSAHDMRVAQYIIESLDDRGYLKTDTARIAQGFGISLDHVEEILGIVQNFEPAGVAARDLAECLIIQLKALGKYNDNYEKLIKDHIEDVAANRLPAIAKDLGITLKEVQRMSDCIKSLEPKPGRQFAGRDETRYIVPDLFLEIVDGELSVTLNETHIPQLKISSYYESLLRKSKNDEELAKYLQGKMDSAIWLIRSLQQRNNTVVSVASAIVNHQQGFFLRGEEYMKPLTLKRIAEETGVHESTVSRTVNGKYLQTGSGIYELKSFFKSGLPKAGDDESVASDIVRKRIRDIIAGEDTASPHSDQYISEELNREGIAISRRTVAKYRDELGILSSSKRRRY
ncbi:MAG: RNA polymerase factor sigma-54 [Firmicutes bacterium]|nr:RNA polymerase factor sigma-54 [Bacillota bacterium]